MTKKNQLDSQKLLNDLLMKHKEEIDEDYELARQVYREVLLRGMEVIPKLQTVCEESEDYRAFDTMGKLTKSMADIADKMLDNHRKKQVVDTENAIDMIRGHESNNVLEARIVDETKFIGSTEQMQKRIAAKIEENKKEKILKTED